MTATSLIVTLGIIAIVCVVGWFLLGQMNLPDPIKKILIIVVVIIVAVVAIVFLLRFAGGEGIRLGWLDMKDWALVAFNQAGARFVTFLA